MANWSEYEAGLRRRGSLTLWMTPQALAAWRAPRRKSRGGQPRYSDLAIEMALMLGCVFGMRLRQTEGLLGSIFDLMGLAHLPVPDHTTLSRRARSWKPSMPRRFRSLPIGPLHVLIDSSGLKVFGAGQWLEDRYGARSRRSWRKLHLALDANSGEIIAECLTDQDAGDASQVEALLDRIDGEIGQFTADGAYDGRPTYAAVLRHSENAKIVIPPRFTAVEANDTGPPDQRDAHIATIAKDGRMQWQVATGYGKRALIETAVGRYKALIGPRLRARSFAAQQTEVAIGCAILNRMLDCGRPNSIRRQITNA